MGHSLGARRSLRSRWKRSRIRAAIVALYDRAVWMLLVDRVYSTTLNQNEILGVLKFKSDSWPVLKNARNSRGNWPSGTVGGCLPVYRVCMKLMREISVAQSCRPVVWPVGYPSWHLVESTNAPIFCQIYVTVHFRRQKMALLATWHQFLITSHQS